MKQANRIEWKRVVIFYAGGSGSVAMYIKILSFNIYRLPLKSGLLCVRDKMNKTWSLPSRSRLLSGESRHLLH